MSADDKGKQAVLEAIDCFETISDERLGGDDWAAAMEQAKLARKWVESIEAKTKRNLVFNINGVIDPAGLNKAVEDALSRNRGASGPGDAR